MMAINPIYLLSVYYEKNRVTGANKRFDHFGTCLSRKENVDLTVIVREGEIPDWAEKYITVPRYDAFPSVIRRVLFFIHLSIVLLRINGVVINDYMPIPSFNVKRIKFYQLVHDIRNFTEYNRAIMRRVSSFIQKKQWQSVSKILTVSEFTKKQLIDYCEIKSDKIIVSYNGIDKMIDIERQENLNKKNVDFLYIATFEKRKNHESLLQAFQRYVAINQDANLIFVGRDLGYKQRVVELINTLGLSKNVDIIESVSEAELTELYRSSKVFISPSLYEGFGMPIIEAMYYGCIVTCSNIDVFKEIAGEFADYFDPNDINSIFNAMEKSKVKSVDVCAQIKYVEKTFTWDAIVSNFLKSVGE